MFVEIFIHNLEHAAMISMFVFVMMILVDYINVLTRGGMSTALKGGRSRQYFMTSFLGATPGCLGSFMNVSMYMRGLLTFGAMAGGMIATSGDEAFVMLTMFPDKAILLFGLLFIIGIISAWFIDKIADALHIVPCAGCEAHDIHRAKEECRLLSFKEILMQFKKLSFVKFLLLALFIIFIYAFISGIVGPQEWGWKRVTFVTLSVLATLIILSVPNHYLEEHIWEHIAKRHLWRVFLWSLGALLVVNIGLKFWDLDAFVKAHMFWVLLVASLVAIVPESGPHLIFVMMFAQGIIPFSVLLASSIVQDGHGLLPLLSYSVKDTVLIKMFNLGVGLLIGLTFYFLGL